MLDYSKIVTFPSEVIMNRSILPVLLCFLFAVAVSGQTDDVPVCEADLWIGFVQDEDKVVSHEFINSDSQILIIGNRLLRLYDIKTGKQIYSVSHDIPRFTKGSFFDFNLTKWLPYVVDSNGKWMVTAERVGNRKTRSAVARNIADASVIATMDIADVAVDFISYDETKNEITTIGTTDKKTAITRWSVGDFKQISSVTVTDLKWHQYVSGVEKMLIGSGDTRFAATAFKHGESLALFDLKTSQVEKTFSAPDLKPRTTFTETVVSKDESFLISRRDDRYFVWDIGGSGELKYELTAPDATQKFQLLQLVSGHYPVFKNGKNLVVYDVRQNEKPLYVLSSSNLNDSVEFKGAFNDGEIMVVGDDTSVSMLNTKGDGKPFFRLETDSLHERFYPVSIIEEMQALAIGRNNRKEKKDFRTEIYDLTGKLTHTLGMTVASPIKVSPDRSLLISEWTGGTNIWNFSEGKRFFISLKTSIPSYTEQDGTTSYGEAYNLENTEVSPNFDKILKHGDDLTALYDIVTGKEVSRLIEKKNAKYTKSGSLKKSGLGKAGWFAGGKYVYAVSSKRNVIGIWKVGN